MIYDNFTQYLHGRRTNKVGHLGKWDVHFNVFEPAVILPFLFPCGLTKFLLVLVYFKACPTSAAYALDITILTMFADLFPDESYILGTATSQQAVALRKRPCPFWYN